MSDERLAALLSELLSDEEDENLLQDEVYSIPVYVRMESSLLPSFQGGGGFEEDHAFDPSAETSLFDDEELEAVISRLEESEPVEQRVTDKTRAEERDVSTVVHSVTPSSDERNVDIKESVRDLPPRVEKMKTSLPRDLQRETERCAMDDAKQHMDDRYAELDAVEQNLRKLLSYEKSEQETTVLERIRRVLSVAAEQDWNPEGRPDAHGGMLGGSVALRVSSVENPLSKALQNEARYGTPTVVCERTIGGSGHVTAVATSRGLVVVQLRSGSIQSGPSYELFELTESRSLGTITAMAFSHFAERDKMLLAVGNGDGALSVWDVGSRKCVATIAGHTSAVHSLSFMSGRAQTVLVSSAANGGMSYHTLISWVVRTSVSTKVLSEGNKQPLLFSFFPVPNVSEASVDTPTASAQDSHAGVGDGMVCLCHPNMCSIGRLSSDGRLAVFYQLPKPATLSMDVIPIAVWSPLGSHPTYASHPNPDMDGRIPCGILAVAWGRHLSLLRIPLLGESQQDPPNEKSLPEKMETADWIRAAHEIRITNEASWESDEDGTILFVCWLPSERLGVLRKQGVLSQFLLFDSALRVLDQVEVDDYPVSQLLRSGTFELATALNSVATSGTTVSVVGSMALKHCECLEWTHSIEALVSIEKWMMAMHMLMAIHCQVSGQAYTTNMGHAQLGKRDVYRINQSMTDVDSQFLEWRLQQEGPGGHMSLLTVAELLVDVCVFSKQTDVLFNHLFPRFLAAGAREVFLEKLEKSLCSNELHARVPPEVMQVLVEYCCEIGEPEKVERCVLRMDISCLDLNQVIPLCIQHHLFTALLSIFNDSLIRDCVTPARYLVNAMIHAQTAEQLKDYGMNLLLYLRCCLLGASYPPGKEHIDPDRALSTKQQMLAFLLLTAEQDLAKTSQAMLAKSEKEDDGDRAEMPRQTGPYPVLRCVLSVNAKLVFRMLKDALCDWECMEKDLLEAIKGGAVEEMQSVRSVTQVIVDALIDLLVTFPEEEGALLDFICHCIASGRAVVNPSTALKLFEHLSTSLKGKEITDYQESEEELQFCGIVRSVGVEVDKSKRSTMKMTYMEGQKALGLAANANMFVAAALLYHLFGDYRAALEHHIKAGNTSSGGCFAYFEASVFHFVEYNKTRELEKLKSAVLCCMGDLANLNADRAASMVMRHFPNDQEAVIQGLQGTRELLFKYLKSSMDAVLIEQRVSLSTNANQLLTKPHCTLYVNLMCEYDPEDVLPFLKTYDHLVDVQQCKKDCLHFGLKDGTAHLLEREGDVMGALGILTGKIQDANRLLEKSVLSRSLDSLETTLSRQLSLAAILRVSSTPDVRLHELPQEVCSSQSALASAVMLCRRNSLERDKRIDGDDSRRQETRRLWFSLLEVYMNAFKELPKHAERSKKSARVPSGFYQKGIIKSNDQFQAFPRLAFLRDIYAALMDEVITAMADYVPLMDTLDLIVSEHGQDRFGDFRSTVLSLINASNYEQSILTSIGRLVSLDAYRALVACHKKRRAALPNAKLPAMS